METQLLLFQESKEEILERKVQNLQEQGEKIRKSLYAKYTELMNLYLEQKEEIENLKASIAKCA